MAGIPDELLNPFMVCKMMGVSAGTLARQARQGRLSYQRTLGGHRRYYLSEIAALIRESRVERTDKRTADEKARDLTASMRRHAAGQEVNGETAGEKADPPIPKGDTGN